ncbi:hypothetical protein B0H10DRAFT_2232870 [Mycena sp. CBHHK59/15]|nr:hypothetical protein B0H10DRAFT_2232870 [Mycena sp. CBHHK59/15]
MSSAVPVTSALSSTANPAALGDATNVSGAMATSAPTLIYTIRSGNTCGGINVRVDTEKARQNKRNAALSNPDGESLLVVVPRVPSGRVRTLSKNDNGSAVQLPVKKARMPPVNKHAKTENSLLARTTEKRKAEAAGAAGRRSLLRGSTKPPEYFFTF